MQSEIEVKFLNVDHDAVRSMLTSLGARLEHPMRLMRRELFDFPDRRFMKAHQAERLRLRDEGDKVTVTYKKKRPDSPYAYEVETTVGSYDDMTMLLKALGLEAYTYQESKRETWHFGTVEVVLDEWPWLDPYIEIEGPSEADIRTAAEDLGFDWKDAKFGSTDTAYKFQYPRWEEHDSIGEVAETRFDAPLPDYLRERM